MQKSNCFIHRSVHVHLLIHLCVLLLTGVTGPPGDPGSAGPKGKDGDNGFSVQGPPGFPGVKGQCRNSTEETSRLMINSSNAYLFLSDRRSEWPSRCSRFIEFWNQGTSGAIWSTGDAGAKGSVDQT